MPVSGGDAGWRSRIEAAAGIALATLGTGAGHPALSRLAAQFLHAQELLSLELQPQALHAAGSGALAALAFAEVLTIEQAVALARALDESAPAAQRQALVDGLDLAEARLPLHLSAAGAWQAWPQGQPDRMKHLLAEALASAAEPDQGPTLPHQAVWELDILRLTALGDPQAERGDDAWEALRVDLFNRGFSPRWPARGAAARDLPPLLPDYPFDRRRYWLPEFVTARAASLPLVFGALRHGVFDTVLAEPDGRQLYAGELSLARLPFLADHVVAGERVVPASLYLDMIAEACAGPDGVPARIERLRILSPCVLGEEPLGVYCRMGVPEGDRAEVDIYTRLPGQEAWRHHVSAQVRLRAEAAPRQHALASKRASCPMPVDLERHRAQARRAGIDYGPSFQAIRELWRGPGLALANIEWPAALPRDWPGRGLHPVLLDACFQAISAAIGESADAEEAPRLFVPAELQGLQDSGRRPAELWCFVRVLGATWTSDRQLHEDLRQRETLAVELQAWDEQGREVVAIERFDAALYRPQSRPAALAAAPQEAWRDWLLDKHWVPMAPRDAGLSLTPSALLALAQPRFGPARHVVDAAVLQGFDELAGRYIRQAFDILGVAEAARPSADELVQRHGLAPTYRRLGQRLLALRDSLPASERTAPEIEAGLRRTLGEETRELDLLVRCGEALTEVLRGRVQALDLLFESAHSQNTEAVYQDSAGSLALNDRLAALVAQAAETLPPGRPLRILEVGGGTGATTGRVLAQLRGRPVEYVFTDVSAHFLRHAEEKFRDADGVEHRLFDLQRDPREQGFEPGRFDIVIAVNVLHATADLARSLDHVSLCLAEGGLLVLRELTRPQAWLDLSFGLTPGWWSFTDSTLREQGPLLEAEAWERLLRERGFEALLATPEPGRTESLFVARKPARRPAGHWVVFADADGWSAQLQQGLAERGQRMSLLTPDTDRPLQTHDDLSGWLAEVEQAQGPITGIVYAWSLRPASLQEPDLATAAEPYLKYPLLLCQALLAPRWRHLHASFLTAGAQAASGAVTQPLQALLWGHVFTFVNENASFARLIDVEPGAMPDAALLDALEQTEECQLALRDGQTLMARLRPVPLEEAASGAISAQASYLITGGFGDLGLQTAQLLAEQGARHLVLLGRSRRVEAEAALNDLRRQGVHLHALQVDVSDEPALQAALQAVLPTLPPLRGVVHSVGVLDDGVIEQQSWERYLRVLRPKVFGAIYLQRALAACELDFFIIYSSAAAVMGNPGQANHAAANAFLDALASYRRGLGRPGLAVGWGAWSDIGAAAARDIGARLSASGSVAGTIAPALGRALIARLFGCANVQLAALPLNRGQRLDAQRQPQVQRLLAEVLRDAGPLAPQPARAAARDVLAELQGKSTPERRRHLETHLQQRVSTLLKHPGPIDLQASLFEHGLDSLLVIDLRGLLEKDFRQSFESTLLFDHPSIAALADFLLKRLPETRLEAPAAAVAPRSGPAADEDNAIAVVGMACRFPGGANTPQQFWELLKQGVDTVSAIPPERWDHARYHDPEKGKPGKAYVDEGCFVDTVDQFYPERFGIAGIEAELMDPQQRLLLDVSQEALESAGLDPTALGGSETGVFMGVMTQDYLQLTQHVREHAFYVGTGSANSVVAGRISHAFGLMGPSMTVDTACSSSLVTVQLACAHLRSGACDTALAGGVSLQLSPEPLVLECAGGMLSPSGRCRTFDAAADGFVRGEGCGVVVLKRLADAVAQGDPILGVIRGAAVTHDGRAGGLTVPNGLSQQRVLDKALRDAGVDPAEVSYIEAHGTGTHLGDPIELNALQSVYGRTPRAGALHIGSVKTNIGHAEAAAGVAGLIKVLLCLQHRMLAPHLHLEQPNPNFDWARSDLAVVDGLRPWEAPQPRRAGVSSFGLSGTNAHVVLEEYVEPLRSEPLPAGFVPLAVLSQVSREQLASDAVRYAEALADGSLSVADVAYTLSSSRAGYPVRAVCRAGSMAELLRGLRALAAGTAASFETPAVRPPLVWRLTAQGPLRWAGSAPAYYDQYPAFRASVDACVDALRARGHRLEARALCTGEALVSLPRLRAGLLGLAYGRLLLALGLQPERLYAQGVMLFCAAALSGAADLETLLDGLLADDVAGWRAALQKVQTASGEPRLSFEPTPGWPEELRPACEAAFPAGAAAPQGLSLDLFGGSLAPEQDGELSTLLCALLEHGQRVDWQVYFAPAGARKVVLPTRRFPTRRYWVPGHDASPAVGQAGTVGPLVLITGDLTSARDGRRSVEFELDAGRLSFLDEHRIGAVNVLPAAATLALVLQAVGREGAPWPVVLQEVRFLRPLRFEQRAQVQLEIGADGRGELHYRLPDERAWPLFASFTGLSRGGPPPAGDGLLQAELRAIRDRASFRVEGSSFYAASLPQDLRLGDSYRRIEQLWRDGPCAVARIRTLASDFVLDPRVLDACLQSVNVLGDSLGREPDGLFLPASLGRAELAGWPTGKHFWCLSRHLPEASGPTELVYELAVFDEQERLCARFEQVSFKKVPAPQAEGRLLHQLAWQASPLPRGPGESGAAVPVLWVGQERPLLSRVPAALGAAARRIANDTAASGPAGLRQLLRTELEQAPHAQALVYADLLDEPDAQTVSAEAWVEQIQARLWTLAQWLMVASDSGLRVLVLTQRCQSVAAGETPLSAAGHAAAALVRTAALEFPSLRATLLDLDRPEDPAWLAELTAAYAGPVFAYRQGQRYQAGLQPMPSLQPAGLSAVLRRGRTYVVSGGLGEIGLLIAEKLVEEGAEAIALLARSARRETAPRLEALRQRGCQVRLFLGDIGDRDSLCEHMAQIERDMPPVAGIVHAAGTLSDALLSQQSPAHWRPVLGAKVQGALHLFEAAASMSLDFFVLCSSIVSIGGSVGQANYAVANALLDCLAQRWAAQGVPAMSINWGAWADTGMARRAEAKGVELPQRLATDQALAALLRLLGQPLAQVACFEAEEKPVLDAPPAVARTEDSALPADFAALPAAEQAERVTDAIRQRLIGFLKIEASQVSDERAFFDLGMDSVTAVDFSRHLGEVFGVDLPVDTIFDYPSVRSLARHVLRLLGIETPTRQPTTAAQMPGMEASLMSIDDLSTMLKLELGEN
ncbi:SDR family NAD(P)-dependent oxidoreductase [Aquabacterium sp. A7-Y]|uniref:SDR family NAD(P)-dependent oxidoreductase n=1 Tax=Aquabacterium sp. A7-Y TaxID=1349605 RepID=UPI00223DD70E|nr:SDR family NAD(P)-dependent oxidoreductase [Aquabacterium sp. A7-Y]MCW7538525.1 SDR family NAD(P)-dependent oxidoreductase [Aquabacterium sp. A7-Y]